MKMLNRAALRLRAKPAFLDWCSSVAVDDPEELLALKEQLQQTGTVYLIDEVDSDQAFIDAVLASAQDILVNELQAWCIDSSLWPDVLNGECLESWFTIDTELMCFDLSRKPLLMADPEALGGGNDDGEIVHLS